MLTLNTSKIVKDITIHLVYSEFKFFSLKFFMECLKMFNVSTVGDLQRLFTIRRLFTLDGNKHLTSVQRTLILVVLMLLKGIDAKTFLQCHFDVQMQKFSHVTILVMVGYTV